MAKIERGSFSPGTITTPTTTTVVLSDPTLIPDEVELFVSSAGASDAVNHQSIGLMTATQQQAVSTFSDASGHKSSISNSKCISHNARVSGAITEIIQAVKPTTPFAAGQFSITFNSSVSGYQVYLIARQY